jgi:hypothetical protein
MKDLSLLAVATMLGDTTSKSTGKKHIRTGVIMPKKDYRHRQARNKMAKESRKRNRA